MSTTLLLVALAGVAMIAVLVLCCLVGMDKACQRRVSEEQRLRMEAVMQLAEAVREIGRLREEQLRAWGVPGKM